MKLANPITVLVFAVLLPGVFDASVVASETLDEVKLVSDASTADGLPA